MKDLGVSHNIKKLHCIIHEEALGVNSLQLKKLTDVAVKAINQILARGLNHRQVQQFFLERQAEYEMLHRVCALREKIATSFKSNSENVSRFRDQL